MSFVPAPHPIPSPFHPTRAALAATILLTVSLAVPLAGPARAKPLFEAPFFVFDTGIGARSRSPRAI